MSKREAIPTISIVVGTILQVVEPWYPAPLPIAYLHRHLTVGTVLSSANGDKMTDTEDPELDIHWSQIN